MATQGAWLENICDRVGHTHQRMVRQLGDLSAEVDDPASDWDRKGKLMDCVLKMMDFVLKLTDCVLTMMDFVLKLTDWDEKGLTFQAFESMKRSFKGGLSSRCIVGESGPIHLVKDATATDASLMPLYRFMCDYADREAGMSAGPARVGASVAATAVPSGGVMSEAEAEAVLRQHFARR